MSDDTPKLGATGEFPDGKLNATDEGELTLTITREGDKVVIRFGTPVAWLGMTPNEAKQMAALLVQRAL